MRICGRCGVYAPTKCVSCEHCGADLSEHVLDVKNGALVFVAIELQFICRGCGLASPLDGIDVDGVAECARCRLVQRFEPRWWSPVLERAHAVGDLWGRDPEGRRRGRFAIGSSNAFAQAARQRPGVTYSEEPGAVGGQVPPNLIVWLAPGHPLARDRSMALSVAVKSPGRVRVKGPEQREEFSTPESALVLHRGFVGAISDDQRIDRTVTDAAFEADGRRFQCSGCGASLPMEGDLKLVRCSRCGSVAYLPSRLRHAMQSDPRPDLWWLVFEGGSPERRRLEAHPTTWNEPQADALQIESPPRALRPPLGRLVSVGWFVCMPLLFALGAGLLLRAPWWVAWLSG